jgi:Tfp pilus assembly protein PilV
MLSVFAVVANLQKHEKQVASAQVSVLQLQSNSNRYWNYSAVLAAIHAGTSDADMAACAHTFPAANHQGWAQHTQPQCIYSSTANMQ